MKIFLPARICVAVCCFAFMLTIHAQAPAETDPPPVKRPAGKQHLFENDKIVDITIRGNLRELMNDRSENPVYHSMFLLYRAEDSSQVSIPVAVKTRGHFRKEKLNCLYPPLLLNFSKSKILKASIFKGQNKLKLVMPCRGDEFVVREWLVYKLYNLVTPKSFRARLLRVKLEDTKSKKAPAPFFTMLLEDEEQMAERNGTVSLKISIKSAQTDREAFLAMAVFEYLAGNTDWSVPYLHNIRLVAEDSNAVSTAVPYDFDHAGLVNCPYAKPAEELNMRSVRERRYRGYCLPDMKKFEMVIAQYNRLKKDIYSLYTDCPLLTDNFKRTTLKYLDEFYATINNANALRREFGYPCDANGTGNIVIKGLRED